MGRGYSAQWWVRRGSSQALDRGRVGVQGGASTRIWGGAQQWGPLNSGRVPTLAAAAESAAAASSPWPRAEQCCQGSSQQLSCSTPWTRPPPQSRPRSTHHPWPAPRAPASLPPAPRAACAPAGGARGQRGRAGGPDSEVGARCGRACRSCSCMPCKPPGPARQPSTSRLHSAPARCAW